MTIKLATNSPQAKADRFGEWRISAGFSGPDFCGKFRRIHRFVSIIFA
jgi:hypothetical protein